MLSFNIQKRLQLMLALQIEPNDLPEEWAEKMRAFKRLKRNQNLVDQVLSPQVVGEVRTIVTESRMDALKKQVTQLEEYKEKQDKEIVEIQARYKAKLKRMGEASEEFENEMKKLKLQSPSNDDQLESKLNEHFYQELKKKAEEEAKQNNSVPIVQHNSDDELEFLEAEIKEWQQLQENTAVAVEGDVEVGNNDDY